MKKTAKQITQGVQLKGDVEQLRGVISHYNRTGKVQYMDEATLNRVESGIRSLTLILLAIYSVISVMSVVVGGNMVYDLFILTFIGVGIYLQIENIVVTWVVGQTVSKETRHRMIREVKEQRYGNGCTDEVKEYFELVKHINTVNEQVKERQAV